MPRKPKLPKAVKKKPIIKIPVVFPEGYTLVEWRTNKDLPGNLQKVFGEPIMGHVFAVLYNQIPNGYPLRGEALNETQAAVELGRMNGYIECLSLLKSLAVIPDLENQVEQTYGSEKADDWSS